MAMNKKDLVMRGDVLARKRKYRVYDETGCYCYEFAVSVHDINRISPVPREMTARELFSTRDRMCNSNYNGGHITPACKTCPLWRDNNGYDMYCGSLMALRPMAFAAIVEKWAREHLEEANDAR